MECTLKSAQPVFEKHDEKFLFDGCARIVESQQIWKGIGIAVRLGDDPVLVQSGYDMNGIGHKPVHRFDHIVAFF